MSYDKQTPSYTYSPSTHAYSADNYSPTSPKLYDSTKLYSSQRFTFNDLPSSSSSWDQHNNLSSSVNGLYSKTDTANDGSKYYQKSASSKNIALIGSKKNMDVSGFPMPNLANNTFLKGLSGKPCLPNFVKTQSKPQKNKDQFKQLNNSSEDKKAVSPPTESIYTSYEYKDYSSPKYTDFQLKINSASNKNTENIQSTYEPYVSEYDFKQDKKYDFTGSNNYQLKNELKYNSKFNLQQNQKYGIKQNYKFDSYTNGVPKETFSYENQYKIKQSKPQQKIQSFGFNDILGTPKKKSSFDLSIQSPYTITTKTPQKADHEEHLNVFAKTNLTPPNAQLMKAGLMGMPNLKVSMEIKEQDLVDLIPKNQFLKLDQIVQKQTDEKYLVKKSVIFNQCSLRDFELGKLVGSGKFGDVHICRHKQTGTMFALKKIFKSTILEYNMVNQFTRQLKIHYRLDHPNIIKLYAHFDDEYHIFLLMEYGESGILMDKVKCAEDIASRYVAQSIQAVMYLHKCKIAHRDIKPENVVLQFGDVVKLCDFGWSSYYENQMKTTFCGTLDYLSPEMKQGGQYDNSVDIWSIGVLTYQLITGSPPYRKQLMLSMKNGFKSDGKKINWNVNYPTTISPLAQSFIRNILKQNPEDRATLRFCSTHTFIKRYEQPLEASKYFDQFSKVI